MQIYDVTMISCKNRSVLIRKQIFEQEGTILAELKCC